MQLCMLCRQAVTHAMLKRLGRPALHAKTLGFVHPVSSETLHFVCEPPDDFASALEALAGLQH